MTIEEKRKELRSLAKGHDYYSVLLRNDHGHITRMGFKLTEAAAYIQDASHLMPTKFFTRRGKKSYPW